MLRAPSLLTVLLCGSFAAGCSDSGVSNTGGLPPTPRVTGLVIDYTDEIARGVPIRVLGTTVSGTSRIDGRMILGSLPPAGAQVLAVGDSITTPTMLVPYTATASDAYVPATVHLPALDSGIQASVPAAVLVNTSLTNSNLPGVSLVLVAGTTIGGTYAGSLAVVGVSPSRLPVPVGDVTDITLGPGDSRAAYLVEPHGATFSVNPATLTVPRLDSSGGPFDAYKVDLTTGQWVLHEAAITITATTYVIATVDEGTLWTVVPQANANAVTVTGRVIAGTQPVAGYVATCWGRSSAPSAADGTFSIDEVPDSYSAYPVRLQPEHPGVDFAPEVVLVVDTSPTLSADVAVAARTPDSIRPTVRLTNPTDGKTDVSRQTQVTVTFSEAVDTAFATPFELVGPNGTVAGASSYDNAFTARFRPQVDLGSTEGYFIVVNTDLTDLAGNSLKAGKVSFKFTTKGGAPTAPPTDTQAFGLRPLVGSKGDTIAIPGRNYTGGTTVTFGSTAGLVTSETLDEVQVVVPDFEPAGNVTVGLSAGGVAIGTLQPLVLDLRAGVETIFDDLVNSIPLVAIDRAAPPADILVDGDNVGATAVTIDGLSFTATNFQVSVGGVLVTTGRQVSFASPAPDTLLTGPVVVRGSNGGAGVTYRFLHVKD